MIRNVTLPPAAQSVAPDVIQTPTIPGEWSEWRACGSRITCNPAPTNTDADYIVLIKDHHDFYQVMMEYGYRLGGSDITNRPADVDPEHVFASYTRDWLNLIVTTSPVFYRRFCAATSIAKRLNLLKKSDRIALFQAVLYANY